MSYIFDINYMNNAKLYNSVNKFKEPKDNYADVKNVNLLLSGKIVT